MLLIKKPLITEKTTKLAADQNKYTFEVNLRATKLGAARELERLFDVTVESTNVISRLGKVKSTRKGSTRKPDRKLMIFKLKQGNKINIFNQ